MEAAGPPNDGAVHREYPQGRRKGLNEVILRKLKVTHIPETPSKVYELTVTDNHGALPLAGEETNVMDYTVPEGQVHPPLEEEYTVVFSRPNSTADQRWTPYTVVGFLLGRDQSFP